MASGTISTGSAPRLLQQGVRNVFGDGLKEHSIKYAKMFNGESSNKAFEVDVQLEGFGLAVQKQEGDDITFDSRQQGFTPKYPAISYAKGFIVTREAIDDELYGQFSKGARALAKSMMITKETSGAAVYNNGFDSNFTMTDGDGSALFSTSHSNGPSGGTFSNRLTVDADLSEASLENMLIQIGRIEDARGLPAALSAVRLIVPTDEEFNAKRILGSDLQSGTANNDTNAIKDMGIIRDGFVGSPYLTDTDAWFILTDAQDGMKHFTRTALEFGQDEAFTSGNMRFKAYERYSFGWTDPRGCFGSQGA